MSIKISSFELENVKRIRAVSLEPTPTGLTIIGGDNGQGKTSVLDAIAWALGGARHAPSNPTRDGSTIPPKLKVTLTNGLVVERKGKNSELKVTDPSGKKSGQQLLDGLISELAIDLPKFMRASGKEKAEILLEVIGVKEQLLALDREINQAYSQRHSVGRLVDQKLKYAEELIGYPEAPEELVSISELIQRQQSILAQNGENQRKRQRAESLAIDCIAQAEVVEKLQEQLCKARERREILEHDYQIACTSAADLNDQSTAAIEQDILNIESINHKVRANLDKARAQTDAAEQKEEYNQLSDQLDALRKTRLELLNGANLPLQDLSIEDGELVYRGQKWDCMSSSEQLIVATAISKALKPDCGFVLLDKLEQMDMHSLDGFSNWLSAEGLQAIATRVSTGDECSIIIEDGYVVGAQETLPETTPQWGTWSGG